MADEAVQVHNNARHEAPGSRPSLTWSNDLALRAQAWAEHLASIDELKHNDGSTNDHAGDGENLVVCPPGFTSFAEATQLWIDEKSEYHGEKIGEGDFMTWGHYTQVIWPETREVGMGMAVAGSGRVFIVGRYAPAGNMMGESAWRDVEGGGEGGGEGEQGNGGLDGLMLLNGYENGELRTIIGWYNTLEADLTRLPDAMIQNLEVDGSIPQWEGQELSATFPDGNTLTWNINSDAQSQADGTEVGTARNNFRSFVVFKDSKRFAFEFEGVGYESIYWLQ